MRFITRIHLSDCGWHEAYYPGTTIQLADPKTGKPRHTIFSLENTGGKTTFLALVLSCFCTSERQFLKTLIRSNQKFADYFGPLPAFILVEWDLTGGNPGFFEAGTPGHRPGGRAQGRGTASGAPPAVLHLPQRAGASLSMTFRQRDSGDSRSMAV